RIKEKGTLRDENGKLISKLSDIFTVHDVPDQAKEICRNWFYKISSIRELIGRIYVEMAIVESYKFILTNPERLVADFERIGASIRGLGDPLIASFARCYLARKGIDLIPK